MKKVLVIDDNHEILELLKMLLEMEGYKVVCKSDGDKVFDAVLKYSPDLILLDIRLGNYDGREICKTLKTSAVTHHIPIILISASDHIKEGEWFADDFIPKPFDIDVLAKKVHKYAA